MSEWIVAENGSKCHVTAVMGQGALMRQDAWMERGALMGKGAVMGQGALMGKGAVMERGAWMGQDARMGRDARLLSGVTLAPFSVVFPGYVITQDTATILGIGEYVAALSEHGISVGCEPPHWREAWDDISLDGIESGMEKYRPCLNAALDLWDTIFEYYWVDVEEEK